MNTRRISPLVLRQRLAEIVEEVRDEGNAVVIQIGGRNSAVLLGYDQYKALLAEAAEAVPAGSPVKARLADLLAAAENPEDPK
jgi:prevent-host-death family protein